MPLQHTYVLLKAWEGILNASGYAILRYMVEAGYLALIARRISLPNEALEEKSST